jgi:hypothetical protein
MSQELVLVACVVLGVILVPSLITVRPSYYPSEPERNTDLSALGSQSAE